MGDYSKYKNVNTVFGGDDGIILPTGGDAARNPSPTVGQLRYNTDAGNIEQYTSDGWKNISSPPSISSISPSDIDETVSPQTIVITGSNFDNSPSVSVIDSTGSEFAPTSLTRDSSTQITITFSGGDLLAAANDPKSIRVTNSTGLSSTANNVLTIDARPVWNTAAGSVGTIYEDNTMSNFQLSATDPEGGTVSYTRVSGAFPTGVSMSSSGVISGTPNVNDTYNASGVTHNFEIQANDGTGNTTNRSFSILRKWLDGSTSAQSNTSCYDILQITGDSSAGANGNYYVGGSQVYCFMQAPWGEPDYNLMTPYGDLSTSSSSSYGFYHVDNNTLGRQPLTNQGTESFTYGCDACSAAQTTYRYNVPTGHVLHYYTMRSHCGQNTNFGFPGETNSCANNGASYACDQVFRFNNSSSDSYVEAQQHSDNCGDPNEMTFIAISKVNGTSRPAPANSTFRNYLRSVNWGN